MSSNRIYVGKISNSPVCYLLAIPRTFAPHIRCCLGKVERMLARFVFRIDPAGHRELFVGWTSREPHSSSNSSQALMQMSQVFLVVLGLAALTSAVMAHPPHFGGYHHHHDPCSSGHDGFTWAASEGQELDEVAMQVSRIACSSPAHRNSQCVSWVVGSTKACLATYTVAKCQFVSR